MTPLPLPNVLIYLTSLFRPGILRPHIRVPSIAHVNFRQLKREGYNAVVIDKDNCITIPYDDAVYPPYQTAWNDLLASFRPGRVLVVSNSAGTRKDPGGIAAEALSLSLRTPVLLHSHPKPGCAPSILSYFAGTLGKPTTKRHEIVAQSLAVREEEMADEMALIQRWKDEVEGPLLGPLKRADGKIVNHATSSEGEGKKGDNVPRTGTRDQTGGNEKENDAGGKGEVGSDTDPLRIVVIGDRLFTDTLLAHRLSRYSFAPTQDSKSTSVLPRVLSIHTTSLPEPKDVRPLRWLEDRLSRRTAKLEEQEARRFILPYEEEGAQLPTGTEREAHLGLGFIARRLGPLRWFTPSRWREAVEDVPQLSINPRSWKPLPLAVGLGRTLGRIGRVSYTVTKRGVRFLWARGRRWAQERKERVKEDVGAGAGAGVGVVPPTATE